MQYLYGPFNLGGPFPPARVCVYECAFSSRHTEIRSKYVPWYSANPIGSCDRDPPESKNPRSTLIFGG